MATGLEREHEWFNQAVPTETYFYGPYHAARLQCDYEEIEHKTEKEVWL